MAYPHEINAQLNSLLIFEITFDEVQQQYLFKDRWTLEINENTFLEQIDQFKSILKQQLLIGRNNLEFLKSIQTTIEKKHEWLYEKEMTRSSFFDKYISLIHNNISIFTEPPIEPFTIDDFGTFNENNGNVDEYPDYFKHLIAYASQFNNYANPLDFQKAKLLYVLKLYNEAVIELLRFVDGLIENYAFIDFSKLEAENAIEMHNEKPICHSNLEKGNVALLFYFLMSEKILFFDETNERNNRKLMQQFLEEHFTYKGDGNEQTAIKNISKSFSEAVGYSYNDKKIKFFSLLIDKLEGEKNKYN